MKLNVETAELFVPDGTPAQEAFARTTHMGIGAHPDDLEILAWDGIAECFGRDDAWFSGVVVTESLRPRIIMSLAGLSLVPSMRMIDSMVGAKTSALVISSPGRGQ